MISTLEACLEEHQQALTGTDGKHGNWLHALARDQVQLVALGNHREQELPFQQRKTIPNAQITHVLGMLFFLTPLRAEHVYAEMSNPGAQVELYDALSVRFQGGVIGVVSGAGAVPPNNRFQVDIRIFGSEGMLLLDVERERLEVRRRDGKDFSMPIPAGEGDYACDVPPHRFIELIRNLGERNNSSGEIAARSVELLDAAYRSARSGHVENV